MRDVQRSTVNVQLPASRQSDNELVTNTNTLEEQRRRREEDMKQKKAVLFLVAHDA